MKQTQDFIQDLSLEHELIKSILKIITKIANNSNSKKVYDVKDVESIIDFIVEFVGKNHFSKEESMYHSLTSVGNLAEIETFNNLIKEHKNEKEIVKEIIVALDKCNSISPGSCQVITNKFTTYVEMLQNHIEMEEYTIFPIIDKLLTEQLQAEIMIQFESIEHRVFKNVTLEQYHQLAIKLEEKYTIKKELVFF